LDEITIDMTQAKVFETLPAGGPYLLSCASMALGQSGGGQDKVVINWTVIAPEELSGQNVREDINTSEPWNLGRLKARLIALGDTEDVVNSKAFKFVPDNYVGRRLAVITRIRPAQGQYPERAEITRVMPESIYEGVGS